MDDIDKDAQKQISSSDLWSYFGAGFLVNCFAQPRITSAEIRDGVVRVTDRQTCAIGVGLQAYYPINLGTYVRSTDNLPVTDSKKVWTKYSQFSIGPYVGASLSSESIIETLAIGLALSHERKSLGVRFGAGLVVDPNAQHLAKDYPKDKAPTIKLPANDGSGSSTADTAPAVKYVRETAIGFQAMISFTPGFGSD